MSRGSALHAGLYGKVPSFGDFLHRRLPSSFVEPWNAWLARVLAGSQAELGGGWMEAYLTSPPWRFVIEPGIVDDEGWLGVVASSVDRVRRCYPITLAMTLPPATRLAHLTSAVDVILDDLQRMALQLIDGSATPDVAMTTIERLARGAPALAEPEALLGCGGAERLALGPVSSPLAVIALRWLAEAGIAPEEIYPLSAWWHGGWSELPPARLVMPGMPEAGIFAAFLDGRWEARGWVAPEVEVAS